MVRGDLRASGIAITFDFKNWSASNYILVPAMIYGGNRFKILDQSYPPYIHDEKDKPFDMPVTTTNILHFNPDGSHANVEMNTGNIATQCLVTLIRIKTRVLFYFLNRALSLETMG